MRGHPSSDWLLAIGTKCEVDPEFFLRHLDFRLGRPGFFPFAVASLILNIDVSIASHNHRWVTIRAWERYHTSRSGLATITECGSHARLQVEAQKSFRFGDSIVRDCFINDTQHFTIEQDISIYVSKIEKSWIGEYVRAM